VKPIKIPIKCAIQITQSFIWFFACVCWFYHLPTLHCTVIGLTRGRFVALGLPSWTHLRTQHWGVFTLQGTRRFASCVWFMVLRKLGNRWKCKGESWFHYTKVLFVDVVGITKMWFYLG